MEEECAFKMLFAKNVPHILEKIFLSLDYMSYRTCLDVSRSWHELLTSERLQRRMMSVYNDQYWDEQNKLLQASKDGEVDKVRRLLSNGMASVNCGYKSLREAEEGSSVATPLGEAVAACNMNVAMVLLRAGADPTKINEIDKESYLNYRVERPERRKSQTHLYLAAREGRLDVVQFFLDLGEDCNQTSGFGDTYLHAAAKCGQKKVVELLLERGANPNRTDKKGVTPLDEAVKNGHKAVVEHLLERGAKRGEDLVMFCRLL